MLAVSRFQARRIRGFVRPALPTLVRGSSLIWEFVNLRRVYVVRNCVTAVSTEGLPHSGDATAAGRGGAGRGRAGPTLGPDRALLDQIKAALKKEGETAALFDEDAAAGITQFRELGRSAGRELSLELGTGISVDVVTAGSGRTTTESPARLSVEPSTELYVEPSTEIAVGTAAGCPRHITT